MRIYQRAQERGEIADDLDLELIAPALAGILMHRAFLMGAPIDDATIERVIDHVILPAVRHPSCGAQRSSTHRNTKQSNTRTTNHKLTKNDARKTT